MFTPLKLSRYRDQTNIFKWMTIIHIYLILDPSFSNPDVQTHISFTITMITDNSDLIKQIKIDYNRDKLWNR